VAAITATVCSSERHCWRSSASGARVQKVVAFVDRDGDSFLQEWSALFALEEASGGRVYFFIRDCRQRRAAETVTELASD